MEIFTKFVFNSNFHTALCLVWNQIYQRYNSFPLHFKMSHYGDIIMGRWRLKSPATRFFTQPFIQAQIKETSKLRVTALCEGNSPVTGEFLTQSASNAENVSIWWRYHVLQRFRPPCSHLKVWNCTHSSISVVFFWHFDLFLNWNVDSLVNEAQIKAKVKWPTLDKQHFG